ncbi:gamma carbonic anhydrase family protein [Rubellimicrobium sp. CFH 75288]|uniref:gamma carbonic anhydrase family protein n=1 Tax=Rubellimicrobium sp. CFH 75288 TaxID=2697034 RepID=UPI001412DFEE|nr:gamma carbonic anhydrase family protein [Rubellimicrobium sp. CFH 75288]NAZ36917.1 gamma carbonic anhydrase family protein [Rubellimicrobium sp. CFH 75288]
MIWSLDGDAPLIHPTAWIAPSAQVIGRVRLGARASVWFGAVLRGDNEWIEIGEETNVQDNAVLHSDWGSPLSIGPRCTIGHGAIVHGCTLGEGVLVGMGATLLNDAQVGAWSLIGAGSLVTEGKAFEGRGLVMGSPARRVRDLDDAALERLRLSAEHYAANASRFVGGLEPGQ